MPQQNMGFNNHSSGYRGGRGGGYNNRGGINNLVGYNRGGFQQSMAGAFQGSPMGGFQGPPLGGMQSYGGFQDRGGIGMRGGPMGMRNGRGAMNSNGMMSMPVNGMGIGAMATQMGGMGMNMPQMGMQGMQCSYINPYNTNPAGCKVGSYMPAGQSTFPSPQSIQCLVSDPVARPQLAHGVVLLLELTTTLMLLGANAHDTCNRNSKVVKHIFLLKQRSHALSLFPLNRTYY